MSATVIGPLTWDGERDQEGHRTYNVTWLVRAERDDGPERVGAASGLPLPGSFWLIGNDVDLWAWCRPNLSIKPHAPKEGEDYIWWKVGQVFSTKPIPPNLQRCMDVPIEDPLQEPMKISGTFTKYMEEATHDRYGNQLKYSSHEPIRGAKVEFDMNRPTVKIEQNVPVLNLALCSSMVDSVNFTTLWGLPPRCIKLSNFSWERLFHGLCYVYYKRVFEFDIRYDGFDRRIYDQGTKVLQGHWEDFGGTATCVPGETTWVLEQICGQDPDPLNPQHFERALDRKGNPIKVLLDGSGRPCTAIGIAVTDILQIGTALQITTAVNHNLQAGDTFNLVGVRPNWFNNGSNGAYTVSTAGTNSLITTGNPWLPAIGITYEGGGVMSVTGLDHAIIPIERYWDADFLLLGIPLTF